MSRLLHVKSKGAVSVTGPFSGGVTVYVPLPHPVMVPYQPKLCEFGKLQRSQRTVIRRSHTGIFNISKEYIFKCGKHRLSTQFNGFYQISLTHITEETECT